MDIRNENAPSAEDVAHEYVAQSEAFLGQMLKREFSLEEMSKFVETAAGAMIGSWFAILRGQAGKEAAETWLKQMLSRASMFVRFRGADAIVKFEATVMDAPRSLTAEVNLPPKGEAKPAGRANACKCDVDKNGRCKPCADKMAAYYQGIFEPFMKMQELEAQAKTICEVCGHTQADYALSTTVPMLLKLGEALDAEKKKEYGVQIKKVLYSMAGNLGVRETPLTGKAFDQAGVN